MSRRLNQQLPKKQMTARSGAAMIELALFLPVFFIITMGTIETCRMLYLRQSLTIAAYECARMGIITGMTHESLKIQCDNILLGRKVRGAVMKVEPSNLQSLQFGDILTVTVEAPADDNALLGTWLYRGKQMVETVKIMAEH